MKLSREEIVHVAALARLDLSEHELETLPEDLSSILTYVEKLGELDTANVPPTSHVVDVAGVTRPDVPVPGLSHEAALAAAPEPVEGGFGVPSPGPSGE